MRIIIAVMFVLAVSAGLSQAFEVDGLTSGMTTENAVKALEAASYTNIQARDNGLIASGGNRFILLGFCKGGLVLVQKQLAPSYEDFVRLAADYRKVWGRPVDAWTEPADGNLPFERYAVSILWRDGLTGMKITYAEFSSNRQLDVIYELKNSCRQVLD